MKNYIKIIFAIILLVFLGVMIFTVISYKSEENSSNDSANILALNDIVKTAEDNWGNLKPALKDIFDGDFVILNPANEVLYDSRKDTAETISIETAIKKKYLYKYIVIKNNIAGYAVICNNGMQMIESAKLRLIAGFAICGLILIMGMFLFYKYVEKRIIIPFKRMEDFAGKVAEGRLDEPIIMDRNNIFGAFSESFDIMREELSESRKRELALQKKERELVASLSHDLKTPITGIKLTSELLQAKLSMSPDQNGDMIEKLGNIYKKADQIDVLVSDLFTSTLDDLGEFRVNLKDETSTVIIEIVKKYDDKSLVKGDAVPEVIINTDIRRLSQVIGNIISNSYKYAGTKIDIKYEVIEGYLKMVLRDYGPGVPENEIDLITNKFYRGKDWKDGKQEGSGLGLYIAKTLMVKMNGELIAESDGKGLAITLLIPLS